MTKLIDCRLDMNNLEGGLEPLAALTMLQTLYMFGNSLSVRDRMRFLPFGRVISNLLDISHVFSFVWLTHTL